MPLDIDAIHDRIIIHWLTLHQSFPTKSTSELADGIYFAMTDRTWPEELPKGSSAMEVCSAVNRFHGLPPLSDEDIERIAARTCKNIDIRKADLKAYRWLSSVMLVPAILAAVSLLKAGFSWWVLLTCISVYYISGILKVALRMNSDGQIADKAVWFWGSAQLLSITASISLSVSHALPW